MWMLGFAALATSAWMLLDFVKVYRERGEMPWAAEMPIMLIVGTALFGGALIAFLP